MSRVSDQIARAAAPETSTFDYMTVHAPTGTDPPTLSSHSFRPRSLLPSRCSPILTTEDMRIAQDMSANATNARHFENPIGPRDHVAHIEHGTLQASMLEGVLLYIELIRPTFVRTFFFLLSYFPVHFTLCRFTLAPFSLVVVATRPHFILPSHTRFCLFPLTHLAGRVLAFTRVYKPSRLASQKRGNRGNRVTCRSLSDLRLFPNSDAWTNHLRYSHN